MCSRAGAPAAPPPRPCPRPPPSRASPTRGPPYHCLGGRASAPRAKRGRRRAAVCPSCPPRSPRTSARIYPRWVELPPHCWATQRLLCGGSGAPGLHTVRGRRRVPGGSRLALRQLSGPLATHDDGANRGGEKEKPEEVRICNPRWVKREPPPRRWACCAQGRRRLPRRSRLALRQPSGPLATHDDGANRGLMSCSRRMRPPAGRALPLLCGYRLAWLWSLCSLLLPCTGGQLVAVAWCQLVDQL